MKLNIDAWRQTSGELTTRATPGMLAAVFVLVVGSYAALSVDFQRTGFGIKGDEATYVAMALSVAYDGDLVFEARDLERFYRVYNSGPEGIFLKRGATASYQFVEAFPFVRRKTRVDDQPDRLYFGKAPRWPQWPAAVSHTARSRDDRARIPVPVDAVSTQNGNWIHRRLLRSLDRTDLHHLVNVRDLQRRLCVPRIFSLVLQRGQTRCGSSWCPFPRESDV